MVMDVDYFMHVCRRTMWFLLWWKLNKKYSDCFFIYKEKGHPMFTTASCPTNVRKKLGALLIFKTWACRNQDSPQSPSNKMSASFYCPISLQRRVRSAPWTAQEENGSIIAFNPLWLNWLYFQTNMASISAYCLHLQRVASLIYNINWTNRQLLYLFFWECIPVWWVSSVCTLVCVTDPVKLQTFMTSETHSGCRCKNASGCSRYFCRFFSSNGSAMHHTSAFCSVQYYVMCAVIFSPVALRWFTALGHGKCHDPKAWISTGRFRTRARANYGDFLGCCSGWYEYGFIHAC